MDDVKERWQVQVEGIVQGVGFRPFVHRLAQELELAGFVCNTGAGVLAEVEGPTVSLQEFMRRLAAEAPPMALVERIQYQVKPMTGENKFVIKQSVAGETLTLVQTLALGAIIVASMGSTLTIRKEPQIKQVDVN